MTFDSRTRIELAIMMMVTMAVLAILFEVTQNELVWDDHALVSANPAIETPAGWRDMLTHSFWGTTYVAGTLERDFYRPATSLLIWFVGHTFNKSPFALHLLSLFLAFLAAMGIFHFAIVFAPIKDPLIPSMMAALFYLAHPLTAEVLCMVGNLSDHLALFALLELTVICARHGTASTKPARAVYMALILLLATLAVTAKEYGVVAILVPFVWPILAKLKNAEALRYQHPPFSQLMTIALPTLAYLAIRYQVMSKIKGVAPSTLIETITNFDLAIPFFATPVGFGHVLLPHSHGFHTYIDNTTPLFPLMFVTATVIAAVAGRFVWKKWPTRRAQLVFSTATLLTMMLLFLPSLLTTQTINQTSYEFPVRYFHLIGAGVALFALPLLAVTSKHPLFRWIPPLIILVLALQSGVRIAQWKNDIVAYKTELQATPASVSTLVDLCYALMEKGAYTDAQKEIAKFETHHQLNMPKGLAIKYMVNGFTAFYRDHNAAAAAWQMSQLLKLTVDAEAVLLYGQAMAIQGKRAEATSLLLHYRDHQAINQFNRNRINQLIRKIAQMPPAQKINERQPRSHPPPPQPAMAP